MLPSAEALHLRKVRKIFLRSLHKSFLKAVKAEERAADGRMKSPEAVTEHGWDCSEETCRRTRPPSLLRLPPSPRTDMPMFGRLLAQTRTATLPIPCKVWPVWRSRKTQCIAGRFVMLLDGLCDSIVFRQFISSNLTQLRREHDRCPRSGRTAPHGCSPSRQSTRVPGVGPHDRARNREQSRWPPPSPSE